MFYSQFRKWKFPDHCDTHRCQSQWNFSRFEPLFCLKFAKQGTPNHSRFLVAVFSCLQPLDWPAKCENLTACVKNTICPGCFEGSSYRFGNQTTFPDSPEKFNVLQKRLFSRRATSCYCCLNLFPSVFSFYNKLSYPGNWLVVFPYLCTHVSVVFITHLNSEK